MKLTTTAPVTRVARALFAIATSTAVVSLSGCLQTREAAKEQEEKQVFRKQLGTLQQTTADVNSRFQDLEEDQRRTNGRLEAVEVKLQQVSQQVTAKIEKANAGNEARVKEKDDAYREEFGKLTGEITQLKAQVAALTEAQSKAAEARVRAETEAQQAKAAAAEASKNPFAVAENLFEKKDWKDAILNYEKYRSQNAKGKNFAAATYKIGVCFQELGMIEEAKAFYDEVMSKFPKSKEAEKAASRMKKLKKK